MISASAEWKCQPIYIHIPLSISTYSSIVYISPLASSQRCLLYGCCHFYPQRTVLWTIPSRDLVRRSRTRRLSWWSLTGVVVLFDSFHATADGLDIYGPALLAFNFWMVILSWRHEELNRINLCEIESKSIYSDWPTAQVRKKRPNEHHELSFHHVLEYALTVKGTLLLPAVCFECTWVPDKISFWHVHTRLPHRNLNLCFTLFFYVVTRVRLLWIEYYRECISNKVRTCNITLPQFNIR